MTQEILLLVEKCSHCFSFYDVDSGERLHSILLEDYPHEFVVDSEKKYAYVGHYGVETSGHPGSGGSKIFQIDIRERCWVRSIDIAPFNRLHGMQMDRQGRLYALSEARAQLVVLDQPRTDNAPCRAVSTGGLKSHLFALTQDGETAFSMNLLSHTVTKIRPYDASFAPVACRPGDKPEGYALSSDEKTLYVTCRGSNTICAIDVQTMSVIKRASSRADATRLYRYRDGRLVATHYGGRSLSLFDPDTLEELAYVPMQARAIALSYHPTQPLAFVSQDDDRLGVFNMERLHFEKFLATRREPDVSQLIRMDD